MAVAHDPGCRVAVWRRGASIISSSWRATSCRAISARCGATACAHGCRAFWRRRSAWPPIMRMTGWQTGRSGFSVAFAFAAIPLAALFGLLVSRLTNEKNAKKKFVVTGRVRRLYGHSLLIMGALSLLLAQGPLAISAYALAACAAAGGGVLRPCRLGAGEGHQRVLFPRRAAQTAEKPRI